jgi:hypothetical protein
MPGFHQQQMNAAQANNPPANDLPQWPQGPNADQNDLQDHNGVHNDVQPAAIHMQGHDWDLKLWKLKYKCKRLKSLLTLNCQLTSRTSKNNNTVSLSLEDFG